MAPLYQRILIATLIIIAFAGRIAVSAIPSQKSPQETVKENSSKSEKSATNENDEQSEEKIKLEDFLANDLIHFHFLNIASAKTRLFSGSYNLVKCYLQTLEYPPKISQ